MSWINKSVAKGQWCSGIPFHDKLDWGWGGGCGVGVGV